MSVTSINADRLDLPLHADDDVLNVDVAPTEGSSPNDSARKRRYRQTSRRRRSKSTTQSCGSLTSASDHPHPMTTDRERSVPNVNFYVPEDDYSIEPRVNLNLSLGSMSTQDHLDSQFGSVSMTTGTPKDLETNSSDAAKQQGFGASLRFVLTKISNWRQCHKANGRQGSTTTHSVGPTPDKARSFSTSSRILRAFSFVGKIQRKEGDGHFRIYTYDKQLWLCMPVHTLIRCT